MEGSSFGCSISVSDHFAGIIFSESDVKDDVSFSSVVDRSVRGDVDRNVPNEVSGRCASPGNLNSNSWESILNS